MVILVVGNLPPSATDQSLQDIFHDYQDLQDYKLISNYGFVYLESETSANHAVTKLNGIEYCGFQITVDFFDDSQAMRRIPLSGEAATFSKPYAQPQKRSPLMEQRNLNLCNLNYSNENSTLNLATEKLKDWNESMNNKVTEYDIKFSIKELQNEIEHIKEKADSDMETMKRTMSSTIEGLKNDNDKIICEKTKLNDKFESNIQQFKEMYKNNLKEKDKIIFELDLFKLSIMEIDDNFNKLEKKFTLCKAELSTLRMSVATFLSNEVEKDDSKLEVEYETCKGLINELKKENERLLAKCDKYEKDHQSPETEVQSATEEAPKTLTQKYNKLLKLVKENELDVPKDFRGAAADIRLLESRSLFTDLQYGLRFLDDIVEFMGTDSFQHVQRFLPIFRLALSHQMPVIRQAASYGVGLMAMFGGPQYRAFLQEAALAMTKTLTYPKGEDARSVDNNLALENFISALTKIYKYQPSCVPGNDLDRFLSVWITWLPVYEDDKETVHVYGFLCDLIEDHHLVVMDTDNVVRIIKSIATCLSKEVLPKDQDVYGRCLRYVKLVESNGAIFDQCIQNLSDDEKVSLKKALEKMPRN